MEFTFKTELWKWQGKDAWCFITLPADYSETIKSTALLPKKGFGSVKVEATIGKAVWKTSIFPDSKSKSYVLPVKKEVRKSETLEEGDKLTAKVRILDI